MFTVLIIDDEIYVTALIEKIINWDDLGMSVIGKTDNGITALEMIISLKPDIVIVDVKMPGYDGITLIQKAREQNSNTKFIVISGHKNFEYAQSAIKYNVEDYLLKPIKKQEMETILKKLKSKLESERIDQTKLLKMNDELHIRQNKIRSYFLKELINGNSEILSENQEEINKIYYLDFTPDAFLIMILKFDFREKQFSEIFLNELLARSASDFSKKISSYCSELLYEPIQTSVVFLLNYKNETAASLQKAVSETFADLKEDLIKFKSIYVTLSFSDTVFSLSGLSDALHHARQTTKSRLSVGMNRIICFNGLMKNYRAEDVNLILDENMCLEFRTGILNLDNEKITSLLTEAFQNASLYNKNDPLLFFNLCDKVFELFFDCIKEFRPQSVDRVSLYAQLSSCLDSCINESELMDVLLQFIQKTVNSYVADSDSSENPAIRIAKKYISENYCKQISLASISNVVNLNPVYFSYIFKKNTGVTFIDYTNQYRIKVAKELLKNIKYNISEIASLSGFKNARYFSKTFQKIVGVTPSDYKNRHK